MTVAGWIRVDDEAARRHPLFGFNGWLRLPSALMVLAVIGSVLMAWQEWVGAGNPILALPENRAAGLIANGTSLALLGLQLAMAVLWFRRWPRFRPFYWGYAAATSLGLPLLVVALGDAVPGGGQDVDVVGETLLNLAFHAAFLAYLQRSRRFRVTFESRVRRAEATPPPASHWPAPPPARSG